LKKDIEDDYNFYGKISADKNSYIDVYPLVGGNVLSVNVELGDHVTKGQVLAIQKYRIGRSPERCKRCKNRFGSCQNNLRVAKEMYEGKLNTERDVLEAKSQFRKHRISCREQVQ
jgi:cobalt-zinc-cadmium efflux system membrane fusion protein